MATNPLAIALEDAGGAVAPRERGAQLRVLLRDELARSARELELARSGREDPVTVVFAADRTALLAVVPVAVAVRADPGAVSERGWLVAAAAIGALADIAGLVAPRHPDDLALQAGAFGDHLALRLPAPASSSDDAELAAAAFEEQAAAIARLRSRALAVPAHVLSEAGDWRAPIAQALRSAEAVARLGGRPADAASVAAHEDAALALVQPDGGRAGGAPARRSPAGAPDRAPDPAAPQRHGQVGWLPHRVPASVARLRRQRARARRRGRARRCWPRACSRRSRASASATCSSTRAARPTSTR